MFHYVITRQNQPICILALDTVVPTLNIMHSLNSLPAFIIYMAGVEKYFKKIIIKELVNEDIICRAALDTPGLLIKN